RSAFLLAETLSRIADEVFEQDHFLAVRHVCRRLWKVIEGDGGSVGGMDGRQLSQRRVESIAHEVLLKRMRMGCAGAEERGLKGSSGHVRMFDQPLLQCIRGWQLAYHLLARTVDQFLDRIGIAADHLRRLLDREALDRIEDKRVTLLARKPAK